METEIAWLAAGLIGVVFCQVFRFQGALAELAQNMSIAENSRIPPINYQNSVTPPWLIKAWMALAVGLAVLVITAGYFEGIQGGGVAIVAFLGGILASGLASKILSRPHYRTYYRWAFHTLANREADYRRDGDAARADAAEHFQFLMNTIVGDQLRK